MHPLLHLLSDCITVTFFAVIFSYYVLLLRKPVRGKFERKFNSLTVVIPAHNEERYIEVAVRSALEADFVGTKEVLVIDDGSTDRTAEIVRQMAERFEQVRLISTEHSGKSASLNLAIAQAKGELLAILDGDSEVALEAFEVMRLDLEGHNVVATTCPILVKNRTKGLLPWLHIELIYSALIRSIMCKVDANVVNAFGMYRKQALIECGGFSTSCLAEDMDLGVRMIRRGYRLTFNENTRIYTNLPEDPAWLLKQRVRWARGPLNVIRQHHRLNSTLIDLYTFPLLLFGYVQGLVMGLFTIYQMSSGYLTYFVHRGQYFNFEVVRFFLDWCTITGLLRWSLGFFTGESPLNAVNIMGAMASLLCYPLYVLAILKFDRKIDIYHLIPLTFMAPFWWAITVVQTYSLPEILRKERYNIWTKETAVREPSLVPSGRR